MVQTVLYALWDQIEHSLEQKSTHKTGPYNNNKADLQDHI